MMKTRLLSYRSVTWILIALLVLIPALMFTIHARSADPAPDILGQVNFAQKLDGQIPLDAVFRDSNGQSVQLGRYLGTRPAILVLGYFNCPNLCDLVRQGLLTSIQSLQFDAGKDFDVIAVSIDPAETPSLASSERTAYLASYGRADTADGFHFLTGSQQSIDRLADAIGFQYAYDPQTKQFAHPSGIVLVTPQGKISRYFYGINFPVEDLRLGLVEASANRIGDMIDQVLLRCYHYDPATGKYSLLIVNAVAWAGIATVLALTAFVGLALRHERRDRQPGPGGKL